MSQFIQLQKYADFFDPSRMPPCHLFGPAPSIRVHALMKDVHDYDEWKRDLHPSIVLDCNEQWSWDFIFFLSPAASSDVLIVRACLSRQRLAHWPARGEQWSGS